MGLLSFFFGKKRESPLTDADREAAAEVRHIKAKIRRMEYLRELKEKEAELAELEEELNPRDEFSDLLSFFQSMGGPAPSGDSTAFPPSPGPSSSLPVIPGEIVNQVMLRLPGEVKHALTVASEDQALSLVREVRNRLIKEKSG